MNHSRVGSSLVVTDFRRLFLLLAEKGWKESTITNMTNVKLCLISVSCVLLLNTVATKWVLIATNLNIKYVISILYITHHWKNFTICKYWLCEWTSRLYSSFCVFVIECLFMYILFVFFFLLLPADIYVIGIF